MEFNIRVSPRAQNEIDNAIEYYQNQSNQAPQKFLESLTASYSQLKTNPWFAKRYKNVRSLKLNRFPYSLFYIIMENNNTVEILACFHNKRHPRFNP